MTVGPCKDPQSLPQLLPTLPFSLTRLAATCWTRTTTTTPKQDPEPSIHCRHSQQPPEVTRADHVYNHPGPSTKTKTTTHHTQPCWSCRQATTSHTQHTHTHTRPCVDTLTRLHGPHNKSSMHPARQLAHSSCCPLTSNATVAVFADTDTRQPQPTPKTNPGLRQTLLTALLDVRRQGFRVKGLGFRSVGVLNLLVNGLHHLDIHLSLEVVDVSSRHSTRAHSDQAVPAADRRHAAQAPGG